jgi:hypothetical protein
MKTINPFAVSTETKKRYATITEAGDTTKIYLNKHEVDAVDLARKAREPFVYLQGNEYPTNKVRLHDIKPEDRASGALKWIQEALHGSMVVEGKKVVVWRCEVYQGPVNEARLLETFLAYYHPVSGNRIPLKQLS